jgi:hypothetical protein
MAHWTAEEAKARNIEKMGETWGHNIALFGRRLLHASPLEPASRQHVRDALSAIAAVLNEIEAAYMDAGTFLKGIPGEPGGALSLLYIIDDGVRAAVERKDRLTRGNWSKHLVLPRIAGSFSQ